VPLFAAVVAGKDARFIAQIESGRFFVSCVEAADVENPGVGGLCAERETRIGELPALAAIQAAQKTEAVRAGIDAVGIVGIEEKGANLQIARRASSVPVYLKAG